MVIFLRKNLVVRSKMTTFAALNLNTVFYESSESKQSPSGFEARRLVS